MVSFFTKLYCTWDRGLGRNLWFLCLYRICDTINRKKLKHSWSNHTISLLFVASAVLARTSLTQQKHRVLVKDLIRSY